MHLAQLRVFSLFVVLTLALPARASLDASPTPQSGPQPPVAAEVPYQHTMHGDVRQDPYFWLKQREEKRVLDHLHTENAYADAVLQPTVALQAKLFAEMKGRIQQDDATYPAPDGAYAYFVRYETGKEYPIYCRHKTTTPPGPAEVILDSNELARSHAYFSVRGARVSPDHRTLAYATDTVGKRIYTLHFKDLVSGKTLPDTVPAMTGNFAWANDNRTLFYSRQHPETLRAEKVLRHELGKADDTLVYEEKDDTFGVHVQRGQAGKHLFVVSASTLSTETRFLPADQPLGQWQVLEPRAKNHEYQVHDGGDEFYVLTNLNAKNFRLMVTPATVPAKGRMGRQAWREVVAHRKETLLEDALVLQGHVVLQERSRGLSQIQVLDRKSKRGKHLAFADPVYVASIGENLAYATDQLRYDYESMTTPGSVYDYDLGTGKAVLRKQRLVPGGFDAANYVSQRLFASARDGAQVPISLVHRKDLRIGAATPLLVYGYGSYGYSMDPTFNGNLVSLLDRGFVYAIAHVRGGSEMGRAWYENGRQGKKKNSFTDFVAVTEHLHAKGTSTPAHTYAMGGSAGGLLVGAVMNLRPDLYQGIVAQVPFVDVVTTMLDASIPLTTAEYDEWGNPNDKAAYAYIKSYSPYDNVAAKAYPNVLVTTGLHDSEVQYWEPAKWVARLRKLNTGASLVLLKTEMAAGHGGKSGRFERLKLWALQYAFLLRLEGIAR